MDKNIEIYYDVINEEIIETDCKICFNDSI